MHRTLAQLDDRLAALPADATITGLPATVPGRRRVVVGGRPVAELCDDDVATLGLRAGLPWDDGACRGLRAAVARAAARGDAARALARRAMSRRELVAHLESRGHDANAATCVIDDLAASGCLDEAALADAICRQGRRRGAGPRLLEHRLEQRRLGPDAIRTAVNDALAGVDLVEEATRLARREMPALAGQPRARAIRRIGGLLGRRGYDEQTVMEALRRVGLDPDAPDDGDPAR